MQKPIRIRSAKFLLWSSVGPSRGNERSTRIVGFGARGRLVLIEEVLGYLYTKICIDSSSRLGAAARQIRPKLPFAQNA